MRPSARPESWTTRTTKASRARGAFGVPATEHAFADPLPERLYLDTDILVSYIVRTQPHHERCRIFLERLFQEGRTTLYICAWAWMEYAHVIRKQSFRASLPLETQQQFRLDRWQQPLIRQTYMRGFLRYLEDLLDQFVWIAIPFTGQVQATALQQMMHYNLGSEDAVHLASATEAQVLDLASLDSGFRRVDGLSLWNDLIHA